MEALRAQLEVLKARNGDDGSLRLATSENRVLHEVARHQQLALAKSQAMMSQCLVRTSKSSRRALVMLLELKS